MSLISKAKEVAATIAGKLTGSHKHVNTFKEEINIPDHEDRKSSPTFVKTKNQGKKAGLRCQISGQADGVEYHHFFIEWALAGAVDWDVVKGVATGKITRLPVLDLVTHEPTGETYPVEQSLLWAICKITELRGFDWKKFDPTKHETFVDSPQNMLVLHEKFHRKANHGIHEMTFPVWIFHAYPRINGFDFTQDEIIVADKEKELLVKPK